MGLESYLFYIEFEQELEEQNLDGLLISIGLKKTKKEGESLDGYRAYYYELDTDKGITEAHSFFLPQKTRTNKFSLRFSVSSPTEVINQTFALLSKLNSEKPIKVRDTEIYNHEYRRLRKEGKVDDDFEGMTKSQDKVIWRQSYIPINSEEFKQNKLGLMKREILLRDNGDKAIVRGGSETIEHIEKKGAFRKFMGWIKKEL